MHEYSPLLHFLIEWKQYVFLILFIGMIFEGDLLLFSSAFLASQGYIDTTTLIIVIFTGILFGDSLWYVVGRTLHKESSFFRKWIDRIPKKYDDHILKHPFRTFLISKFAYNMHHPMLLRAGALHLNYRTLLKSDISSTIIWITIVGGLGYISGSSFLVIKHYLKYAEILIFVAVVFLFLVEYFIISRKLKEVL